MKTFEERLKGGHPNSLGNTLEVVAEVLAAPGRFEELFYCYFSEDEVVRLRVSNAMKRICKAEKALLIPYIDRFLEEIARIEQASTQWTLSQLFGMLKTDMAEAQRERATAIMMHNLATHQDWIVLNQTMHTLTLWAEQDPDLRTWIIPHLERLQSDQRKSVSGTAMKMRAKLKRY